MLPIIWGAEIDFQGLDKARFLSYNTTPAEEEKPLRWEFASLLSKACAILKSYFLKIQDAPCVGDIKSISTLPPTDGSTFFVSSNILIIYATASSILILSV